MVLLPRLATRLIKPLVASALNHRLACLVPSRTITTVNEHRILSPVGHSSTKGNDPKLLEGFLGTWVYVNKDIAELSLKVHENVAKGYGGTYIKLGKQGDIWNFESGHTDSDTKIQYEFQLDKPFHRMLPNGAFLVVKVYQSGDFLIWKQGVLNVYESEAECCVRGQYLIWTTYYNRGWSYLRVYQKGEIPKSPRKN